MSKTYKPYRRNCDQCGAFYVGSGKSYCSNACRGKSPMARARGEKELERRKKISEAQRGRKLPKEWCEAISRGHMGKRLSEEHRRASGLARRGLPPWNKGKTGMQVAWNKGKSNWWCKGEKNNNWKGGISPVNKAFRESLKYKEWRTKVFTRDDYTCQNCGQRGMRLHADHIKPFCLFPELRLDLHNGRTLCEPCHDKIGWQMFRKANPRKRKAGPSIGPAVA